jgi:hypothetical protein
LRRREVAASTIDFDQINPSPSNSQANRHLFPKGNKCAAHSRDVVQMGVSRVLVLSTASTAGDVEKVASSEAFSLVRSHLLRYYSAVSPKLRSEQAMLRGPFMMRSRICCSVAAAASLVALAMNYGAASSRSLNSNENNEAYSRRINQKYDYRFGAKVPFLPSNATSEGGGFIPPGKFPTAGYCGHCHAAPFMQWQESAHRNSFRAPFYKKNVDLLINDKGIAFSRHCEGCHNPIALLSGALTESQINRSFDEDGITCSVCGTFQTCPFRVWEIVVSKSIKCVHNSIVQHPHRTLVQKGFNDVTFTEA